jgi:N-acetylmuramoyl-L-alanine amidase
LDAAGNLYVAGQTSSWDFPVRNPVQSVNGGGFGGFVASFSTVGPTCASVGPNGVVTGATSGLINVYAYGVQNATSVKFPAWSQMNGQDDLIWHPGTDLGGGTWTGSIDLAKHRPGNPDYGDIIVDAWMQSEPNAYYCGEGIVVRTYPNPPVCSGVGPQGVVTSATSGSLDFYAYGVQNASSVSFPTWSHVNGQDDIIWYPGVNQGGGTWKASIDLSKHRPGNPDYGDIIIDVWLEGSRSVYCGETILVRRP